MISRHMSADAHKKLWLWGLCDTVGRMPVSLAQLRAGPGSLRAVALKTLVGSVLPDSSETVMTTSWTWQAPPVARD